MLFNKKEKVELYLNEFGVSALFTCVEKQTENISKAS